jgi:membrane protease YdiL (CAAX protease family)
MNTDLNKNKESLTIVMGILFMSFLLLTSLLFPQILFNTYHYSYEVTFIISRVLIWLSLLLMLLYAYAIEKKNFLLWFEKDYQFSFYIVATLSVMGILFAGSAIINLFITKVMHLSSKSSRFELLVPILKKNIWLCVATAATAGITEELLFRGYLLPRLHKFFKVTWLPVIISSVLFGLLHFSYGTLIQIIGPFYIGLVFAIFYQKYRNIKVIIVCHFLWDIIVLAVMLLKK